MAKQGSYNYALSQVFRAGLLKRLNDPVFKRDFESLLRLTELYPAEQEWCFFSGLSVAYNYLLVNYRCEYVYKNEIANQLVLEYHPDNSAAFLNEFGLDQSIADVVVVNGETVAYEIKTELDNFDRLKGQLDSYSAVFDKVNVVTHEGAVKSLMKRIEGYVGIIILDSAGHMQIKREAKSCINQFDPVIASRALRQIELTTAYKKYEGELPSIGTGYIGAFCRAWFEKLDSDSAHFIFSESLKARRPSSLQFAVVTNGPRELSSLLLSKNLTNKTCREFCDMFQVD